jgi:ATP-dependent Clp protease ATP-binding subunit ClpA
VIDASHLAAGLLSEPDGLAARAIHGAGLTDEQILAALGLPAPIPAHADAAQRADPAELRRLRFTEAGRAALRGALKEALRLGNNYIGTEHLLLGILFAKGDAGQLLIGLGFTAGQAEKALVSDFARVQAERGASS